MKKDNNKDEHKYLMYGISIGLLIGTAISAILFIFLDNSIRVWLIMGPSLGIMLGIVVGTTIDYEIKKKKSDK